MWETLLRRRDYVSIELPGGGTIQVLVRLDRRPTGHTNVIVGIEAPPDVRLVPVRNVLFEKEKAQ